MWSAGEEVAQETMELAEVEPTTRGLVQESVKPSHHVWAAPYHANTNISNNERPRHTNRQKQVQAPSFRETESPIPLPAKGYRQQHPQTDPDVNKLHNKLTRAEIKEYNQLKLRKEKMKMKKDRFELKKQAKEGMTSESKLANSLLPNPDGFTHVIINHKEIVPVSVFGQPLPFMPPQPFSLPWMAQEDETVTEDSVDNNKHPSQSIPSTNASILKTKLKVVTQREPAAVIKSKPYNLITSLAKPYREPVVLKQAVRKRENVNGRKMKVVEGSDVSGLKLPNYNNKGKSSKKVLLQKQSVRVKSARDATKENLNMSAPSLGSKTPDKSFTTSFCQNCNICGSQFYQESAYKRHLALTHHKVNLIQRYNKFVKMNFCQICNFSSKASTETQKTTAMVAHLGVKHSKGIQAGNQKVSAKKMVVK